MSMNKADRESYLLRTHRHYEDYNQEESSSDLLMVSCGHPFVLQYKMLRDYFDRLRYACNSSERLIAFGGPDESASIIAPELQLTWDPKGLKGFYRVYPGMGERWEEYIKASAKAGWPEGVKPTLDCGTIRVISNDAKMIGKLFGLIDGRATIEKAAVGGFEIDMRPGTAEESLVIIKAIQRGMKKYLLPELVTTE